MKTYRVMQYDDFSGESYLVQEFPTLHEAKLRLSQIYDRAPAEFAMNWYLKEVVSE